MLSVISIRIQDIQGKLFKIQNIHCGVEQSEAIFSGNMFRGELSIVFDNLFYFRYLLFLISYIL